MRVDLAYGEEGLSVEVPERCTTVITPRHEKALDDPHAALLAALRSPIGSSPLRDLVRSGQKVAISVCDITRAQPREPMLRALFEELDGRARPEDVVILVATGTHRANTAEELRAMLGAQYVERYRVVNHLARDTSSLVDLGRLGNSVPTLLQREWVEAEVRITTGFVEPHFFAGFSGGPKMVAPGLAGMETVLVLHDAQRIGHRNSTWGIIEGNPIQQDIRAIASDPRARPHFSIDVLLNHQHRITRVFAGDLFEMHREACKAAKVAAMQPVERPFDVVLTTNSGYPLDQNLYQSVKGMSAAAQVVKEGGAILCATECRDGLPDHGSYADTLRAAGSLGELLQEIEARDQPLPDQWQIQVQALISRRATLKVKSDGLAPEQLREVHFEPIEDLEEAIERSVRDAGPNATLCVLPEGPQTIPYLSG